MNAIKSIESVDLVDKLMTCFRNEVIPSDKDIARAYEIGINVKELKRVLMEVEDVK